VRSDQEWVLAEDGEVEERHGVVARRTNEKSRASRDQHCQSQHITNRAVKYNTGHVQYRTRGSRQSLESIFENLCTTQRLTAKVEGVIKVFDTLFEMGDPDNLKTAKFFVIFLVFCFRCNAMVRVDAWAMVRVCNVVV